MISEWFSHTAHSSQTGREAMAFPWHETPLGDPSTWDETLRQSVRLCFSTQFPVMIAWGPELTMIYNDGYAQILGPNKRRYAMGKPIREVWTEIWDDVETMFGMVFSTVAPVSGAEHQIIMNRSGFDEETYFTFSCSPLVDSTGQVVGVMDISAEITEQVVSVRRLSTLDDLHSQMQTSRGDGVDRMSLALQVLAGSTDLSRSAIMLESDGQLLPVPGSDVGLDLTDPEGLYAAVLREGRTQFVGHDVAVPLVVDDHGTMVGLLVAQGSPMRPVDSSLVSFVELVASALSGALQAVSAQRAVLDARDARTALIEATERQSRETSIALQQSMLTPPVQPCGLDLMAWYQPSREDLQIGGDWYDSFLTKNGCTTLVVGDVTGHDHVAAAAMGQLRGLIRAIAFDSEQSPARVFERADTAIAGLDLGHHSTATAVVVQVEEPEAGSTDTSRTLRWSNAAHPYPAVVRADGSVELLRRTNDIPLGITQGFERREHEERLHVGDTLVLYTDGLVERRGEILSTGLDQLTDALADGHARTVVDLAEHILSSLVPTPTDDVALVVVRVLPAGDAR